MTPGETAAVVVTWEGGERTDRCVASLLAQTVPLREVIVVDNASGPLERARLSTRYATEPRVQLLLLEENRQFAGGLNAGAALAFARGATRVLLLNNDTHVAAAALAELEAALAADPQAGIVGPRVLLEDGGVVLSDGECHVLPLLCVPRTLLRPRRPDAIRPYRVSGVMGCALLVTRPCFEATGGYADDIEVYYEDVDLCLGARAAGFHVLVAPRAVVRHAGMRGFAGGLTPWAAFLKARNPWVLLRRRGRPHDWLVVVPTYAAMLAASTVLWAVRGRRDVVRALWRGAGAGVRRALGRPFVPAGAPTARA